jgi:hypothetical protein
LGGKGVPQGSGVDIWENSRIRFAGKHRIVGCQTVLSVWG